MAGVDDPVARRWRPFYGVWSGRAGSCVDCRSGPAADCAWSSTRPRRSTCTSGCTSTSSRRTSSGSAGRGTVCFDIGAFDGYYALVFARLTGSTGGRLRQRPGLVRTRAPQLRPQPGGRRARGGARVLRRLRANPAQNCVALDDVLARGEVPVPGLIKMDVDRAELSALTGAKELLASHRPHLIVEVHSLELERQCAELMIELGYPPRIVTERRWLRENRPIEHNRWIVAEGR